MARHDKQPDEEFEDHGVLDSPIVDTTAIDALGSPTSQVRINLPRGYEDLDDDEDVVDDAPDPFDNGRITLNLPNDAPEARDEAPDAVDVPDDDRDGDDAPEDDGEPAPEDDTAETVAETIAGSESEGGAAPEEDSDPEEGSAPEGGPEPESESAEASETEVASVGIDVNVEADRPAEESAATSTAEDVLIVDEAPEQPASAPSAEGASGSNGDDPGDLDVGELSAAEPEASSEEIGPEDRNAEPEPTTPAEEPRAVSETGAEPYDDSAEDTAMPRTDAETIPPHVSATRFVAQAGATARGAATGGESASQLTSDRLVEPRRGKPRPEGTWRGFWYSVSGGLINLGDSRSVRERKDLLTRIAAPLPGRARFVPVLSRKGGVGKTTVTTLLGMALADARDDRVVAVDANPDRGTLSERIATRTNRTVRDVVRRHDRIRGYADISDLVARDVTRLDIVASDADPHIADAFDDADYRTVADVTAQYYSMVLTDTGTGIIHSVMSATLDLADQLVVVAGASVDESRLASETLTWLEAHDREDLVRNTIVVVNQSAPGKSLVRVDEVEAHFASRVRAVVRLPYDESLATGGAVSFEALQPATKHAARRIAAEVVEGMRSAALHSVADDA